MNIHRAFQAAPLILAIALAACDQAPPEAETQPVRAIKPYYVVEPAGGDVRRYSGTVAAANTSALSFAVSGTVQTVLVNQGDRVTKGQRLATLDPSPFELDVQAARSELATAQAGFDEAKVNLARQRQLFERGWVARAALDQSIAAFDAAEGDLNLARSRLGIADRDAANANLTAPFDGVISLRDVEPFVEVSKGEAIFQIDSEGALEVELSIPDSVISRLVAGTPVMIEASTIAGCGCPGRITEVGVAAGSANAVPVTAAILESPGGLIPGMAVEASIMLSNRDGPRGFLVPLVAVAAGDDQSRGYVFKYDPAEGVVRRTAIKSEGIISGNLISVAEGVGAGDIVAGAGVSFLRDGQKVKLLGQ